MGHSGKYANGNGNHAANGFADYGTNGSHAAAALLHLGCRGALRPVAPVHRRSPKQWANDRSLRGRLIGLLVVIVGLWLAGGGLINLSSAKSAAHRSDSSFEAFRAFRDAYEGGLTDDGQSNLVSAVAALPATVANIRLERVRVAQISVGNHQTVSDLNRTMRLADPSDRPAVRRLIAALAAFNPYTRLVLAGSARPDAEGAISEMAAGNLAISNKTQADFNVLNATFTAAVIAQRGVVASLASTSLIELIVLVIFGTVLTVAATAWVIGSISRPVKELEATLAAVTAGDLAVPADFESPDELGRLAKGFNQAIAAEESVAPQLVAASRADAAAVADASAAANQALSVVSEQDSAEQTLRTAVQHLASPIREIAKNAAEASQVATQAAEVAETTNATVNKLGESSAEIGNIVKVITTIAQQSNLLALNATSEAARAGEGFGVLANEVKDLARKTVAATEDISAKIGAIQGDTSGAVRGISRIAEVIAKINELRASIAAAAKEQSATTNEIVRSLAETAAGSSEITTGIASAELS